jgi:hypothetical protein
MRTPVFLLGATLLFWGWQTGHLLTGALVAVLLESSRVVRTRWEFSEEEYNRIWNFCTLLLMGSAVYAFTSSNGPSDVRGFLEHPSYFAQRNVGNATSRAAAAWLRWLPILLVLPVGAQAYGVRQGVPLESLSLILRRRRRKALQLGHPLPASRTVDVSYPYFALSLFAASIHQSDDNSFFWGACVLVGWALWPQRCPRFGFIAWGAALGGAIFLGYAGQRSVIQLERYVENFNPQWISDGSHRHTDAEKSKTALGQIGRIHNSAAIVIRLETKEASPPPLLREASYRSFNNKSQIWDSGPSDTNGYTDVKETALGSCCYPLVPDQAISSRLSIGCYLDHPNALLPLPSGTTGRLEKLWAINVQKSPLGDVLVDGPGLVIFDACCGPGPGMDAPANYDSDDDEEDLAVPPNEVTALEEVIAKLGLRGLSQEQVLRAISGFFRDRFTYSLTQERPRRHASTNETVLSRFLLHSQKGHCEYFATATVLLLRELHIPARYAVGYSVHEGSGGKYVVRQRDAHAWCLVWDAQRGIWRDFDTTPPSYLAHEAGENSPLQFLLDGWSRIVFEFSKFRWGQSQFRQYLVWAMVPVLAVLLYQIVSRSRRRRPQPPLSPPPVWPGLDSEFYRLEKKLLQRGVQRRLSESLSDWLPRATTDQALADLQAPLRQLLQLHYRYRFDPQGLSPVDREQLQRQAQACLATIERRH